MTNVNELACTYSTLILADDNIPVTAEKINTLLKAANVSVESIWPTLFARAVAHINVHDLITNIGSASAAPAASAVAAPAATQAAPAAAAKKEEKKEEKKEDSEEEDEDMGFGLFD